MDDTRSGRALDKMEEQMIRENRFGRKWYRGLKLMHAQPKDAPEVRELIEEHNHKVRSHNQLGVKVSKLGQRSIDEWRKFQNQPEEDVLGVFDLLLKLRNARHTNTFERDPQCSLLFRRMKRLRYGKDGIRELSLRIAALRAK